MKSVDRGNYVSTSPYLDQPQSIGYGVTISAPHMVLYKTYYYVYVNSMLNSSERILKFYVSLSTIPSIKAKLSIFFIIVLKETGNLSVQEHSIMYII